MGISIYDVTEQGDDETRENSVQNRQEQCPHYAHIDDTIHHLPKRYV